MKRYASTDGVRKHARKTHTTWLKSVDETSLTRDRETESKPSTYCIAEFDDPSCTPCDMQPPMPLMGPCRDVYDDSMPPHLRQASIAAATAFSMSLHSGASLLQPRMAPLLPRVHSAEGGRRMSPSGMSPSEFSQDAPLLPRMTAACPSTCGDCYDSYASCWASENLPPPPSDYAPISKEGGWSKEGWSNEFHALLSRAEASQLKRPSPVVELEESPVTDPLCLTPPMAPATSAGSSQRLSPFELEEKRPSKLQKMSNVPLRPEPLRSLPADVLGEAPDELGMDVPVQPMPLSEAEYFDFFEALLAM